MSSGDEQSFRTMFDRCSGPVFAYARRHSDAVIAEDIAAETFLIAWRRRDELPADPLPWLLVVARNLLANKRRSLARDRDRLKQLALLQDIASLATPGVDQHVVERETVLAALARLTALEREAILLVGWDGLPIRDAPAGVIDDAQHRSLFGGLGEQAERRKEHPKPITAPGLLAERGTQRGSLRLG